MSETTSTRKRLTKEERAAKKASKPKVNTLADIKALNDIEFEFIVAHVKAQGRADIDWLKALSKTPVEPDKNGKPRKISFIEMRKKFAEKYRPDLVSNKVKKPSMFDTIDSL